MSDEGMGVLAVGLIVLLVYLGISLMRCKDGDVVIAVCPDGSGVVTAVCENGGWVETGDRCP